MKTTRRNAQSVIGTVLLLIAAMLAGMAAYALPSLNFGALATLLGFPDETDHRAPVDYGAGPGKPRSASPTASHTASPATSTSTELTPNTATAASQAIPSGDASASTAGVFGAPITWPI